MIPSLKALRAFDAAAELGSFRAAADQLSISPTAVSHHMRTLEDQLNTKLFNRVARSVVLTRDGRYLARATRQAFGLLEESVETLYRSSRSDAIRIAAGSLFAARKLLPLMSQFWQYHPEIDLEVVTYRPLGTAHFNADIVIQWERIDDAPPGSHRLLELQPVAVASPDFIERHGKPRQPRDLKNFPLVHQRDLRGWTGWFQSMNVETDTLLRGPVLEDANIVLRAAIDGQGAILGWLPLVEQDLRENLVQRLFDEDITPTHAYFLAVKSPLSGRKEVQTVVDWLVENCR